MKEFIKKNFAILLAFILPIALIAIVALSSYIPSALLKTDYDFVYATCDTNLNRYPYTCDTYLQKHFSVVNNKLVETPVDLNKEAIEKGLPVMDGTYTTRIFLHDTEKNESKEISLEDAKALSLNSLITSPDGITVSSDYDRGAEFFPFFNGGSTYGYYLTKGNSKSRINLINNNDRYYYRNNFQFIGWVVPSGN